MTAPHFKLESLFYQTDAVDAVVRVFDGTTKPQAYEQAGNRCQLSWEQLKKNITTPVRRHCISDITIERVRRVIQGNGDNPQPIDAGFKVFTLEKSAFPRADFAPDPDASAEQNLQALKAFIATKETNLFSQPDPQAVRDEVLLKCGFQLDVQLTPIDEVTANPLYSATDQQTPPRQAIVCFDTGLATTTLEWLRQQKGQRVIVLEAALDTTAKWNLHHQLGDDLTVF
jgi:adenine-specific DNA-methyltransferase